MISLQRTFDWVVGLEEELPEIAESVDEALAREVSKVGQDK